MSNFYAMILRMKHIDRWGLMRNTWKENLSVHALDVAVLVHALCLIGNERFGKDYDAEHAAVLALFHDASEILTGDLPTPIKYYNPAIRDSYKAIESVAQDKLLSMLPEDLAADFEAPLKGYGGAVEELVKAADKLSAYTKCVEEEKAGNTEFRAAAEQIRAVLRENPLPEVQYFMEHFLPAFSLTLDELNESNE